MTTTKFRTHRITRFALRTAGLAVALRAGWICDDHHLPLLLTLCLVFALLTVLEQTVTQFTTPERTLSCPQRCGVTITAPSDIADRYQADIDEHVRTAHPAPTA